MYLFFPKHKHRE